MKEKSRRRVLLLGIEDGLLWQLTKALAGIEDLFEVQCARDFSVAGEVCAAGKFDVIVVDGWEQSWQAGYLMGWDKVSEMKPGKWVILVDSPPMAGLLDEGVFSSAVFLEKPFNPKEFPAMLSDMLERPDTAGPQVSSWPETVRADPFPETADFQEQYLVPGESYRRPECPDASEPGVRTFPGEGDVPRMEEPDSESGGQDIDSAPADPERDFYSLLDSGFACLKGKDYDGASRNWQMALLLRPHDKRLRANLLRLQSLPDSGPGVSGQRG